MKQFAVVLCALMLLGGCNVSVNEGPPKKIMLSNPGTEQQQHQVFEAAGNFVHLLDAGKVDETWAILSPALKNNTSEFISTNTFKAMRLGLGTLKEHGPVTMGFTDQMPDAPAGYYAVVEFQSTYSVATVKEKVVLREDDGQWLIAGYFVEKSVIFGDNSKKTPL